MLAAAIDPPLWLMLPFALLLLCIAVLPLVAEHFWHAHYPKIAAALGAFVAGYYLAVFGAGERLLHVGHEYISFIVLIGSLFVVAGGVHLRVRGEATPLRNVLFLAIGAVLANFVGTTGASVLLIRPWIRMNKYRVTEFHVAFFILIVSNCGGCLTPIGDPPLFLGYLKGVPFWWVLEHCWPAWLLANGLLLAVFYALDRRNFLRAPKAVRDAETAHETFRVEGLRNFAWLALILGAVFISHPLGLREALMVFAAAGSYFTTPKPLHEANDFTWAPIKEVAWLFLGIFATMIPALDYLELHAADLGLREPMQFYWLTGALSGVLDNAPTYLTFLAAAVGIKGLVLGDPGQVARFTAEHGRYLLAISLGAVFFGAMTYIGNGPNFMVRAIALHAKVKTPTFFGYIGKFALPVLLPIVALVGWVFFGR